jgi:hypothetical protein
MHGQALPLRTVVVAAIALIVLIIFIMVVFNIGGLADFFWGIAVIVVPESTFAFRFRCQLLCTEANGYFNSSEPCKTRYCVVTMDTSGEGGIPREHCWDDGGIVMVNCTITGADGLSYDLSAGDGGCDTC